MAAVRGRPVVGSDHRRRDLLMRGDIYLINLDPVVGSEANKTRPAVIVSNDHANAVASRNGHGVVTVVPLTSNTAHVYSFQVLIDDRDTGLTMRSKAQAEQIRAVDVSRLVRRIGGGGAANMAAPGRAGKKRPGLAQRPPAPRGPPPPQPGGGL